MGNKHLQNRKRFQNTFLYRAIDNRVPVLGESRNHVVGTLADKQVFPQLFGVLPYLTSVSIETRRTCLLLLFRKFRNSDRYPF